MIWITFLDSIDRDTVPDRTIGPFDEIQVTYLTLRDNDDNVLAEFSPSDHSWRTEDGLLWTDFVVVTS